LTPETLLQTDEKHLQLPEEAAYSIYSRKMKKKKVVIRIFIFCNIV
jgi:hypothetical protein